MEQGAEQVVAVLGTMIAGAAYLPIDPNLPESRVHELLEIGEVSVLVTQSWLDDSLVWPSGVVRLVVDRALETGLGATDLDPRQTEASLAYVIFTSGSTGTPKGVMIDHRGAVNTILDINDRFAVAPDDRVLAVSSLNFDLSVWDIFGTLAAGATVVLPDAAKRRDPAHWLELMTQQRVTVWNSVPVLMEMLVEHAANRCGVATAPLRLALLSGDWVPVTLADQVRAVWPGTDVVSLGGATEASIWSILHPIGDVDPEWRSIPYGRAMANQGVHVLDEAFHPRPDGVPGRIYISGVGLALGYFKSAELTADKFVHHPRTGERLYRTGDLGQYLPDGNIEFLGREDLQVKISGHRIELGEIEAVLAQHPKIGRAVVTTHGPSRRSQLVAFYVPTAGGPGPDHGELRDHLLAGCPSTWFQDRGSSSTISRRP